MINLVYIASIGRSGSTLLESMLGAHSLLATTGELHIWPHEIRRGGVRSCGCGEEVPACPFWNEVRSRVDPMSLGGPGLDFFREAHTHGRTIRPTRLSAFGSTATERLRDRALIHRYGANSQKVFEAFVETIETHAGVRPQWVVDASKDAYRLAWLARSGLFSIKVVHLVKDPRAFAYSVTKHLIHGEGDCGPSPAATRLYYTARQSLSWTVQNMLLSRLGEHVLVPDAYLLLRYEDLAADPYGTFEKVCAHVGIPYEAEAVESFRAGSVHTIAGNPMRYEKRGIKLDERWKTHLPLSSRRVATAVAQWTEQKYGYGLPSGWPDEAADVTNGVGQARAM